jgi:alpha-ketoglutarate-dependent taurine dioxygenase
MLNIDAKKFELDDLLSKFDSLLKGRGADQVYAQKGASYLARVFQKLAPELAEQIKQGVYELEKGAGYFLLANTQIDKLETESGKLLSIMLAAAIGVPTRTNPKKDTIAWPIKVDESTRRKTFSQTNEEASFHTDTQYFLEPERYFALFCVHADQAGYGSNQLLDGWQVIQSLDEQTQAQLSKDFPFRVPSIFTDEGDKSIQTLHAPIIDRERGIIRYRHDTLLDGLATGVKLDKSQLRALEKLEAKLEETEKITHHLLDGEALFVNNHRLLHARSAFKDARRLLYRVRMRSQ